MKRFLLLLLFITATASFAQETHEPEELSKEDIHVQDPESDQHGDHHDYKHSIALLLGHTHISEGRDAAGDTKWLAVPSFGLDYNYFINDKWSVGWHNDIIIESFFVERHLSSGEDEEILERKYPIASLVMVGYKVAPLFAVFAGAGGEFAEGENFFMYRLGFEKGWHLQDPSWELVAGINYDFRIDAYNIWNLTVGIGKKF